MKKLLLIVVPCIFYIPGYSQDFSNKGKEFWISYGNHVRMFGNISAQMPAEKMQLYITSDVNTTGIVEIPGVGFSLPFSVTANRIATIDIPRSAALLNEGTYNLGIHVKSQKPIIVYSFIYVNAISGATLCLPVTTLGREYYSINYTQISNDNNSYSYFNVIASDTGVTTLEIIPSQNTRGGHLAGVPYLVNLQQGQVYQALGELTSNVSPYKGVDLTGSKIRSISTGAVKCKKIAVFCGSGKISIGCLNSGTSDNLYQQMYPLSTWGKTYIAIPSMNKSSAVSNYNFYRIFKSHPSAIVKLNGSLLASSGFINNQYYEFGSKDPNYIESDKPILIAQYFTSTSCGGNAGQGDPEMIYLNPVEQTISNVTLNSMQPSVNTNINEHYINVVLKNIPEVINSFKIDGVTAGQFNILPSNANYAYAQVNVSQGTHTLICNSGFNAISYGFGSAESYGYSAGTNLKDLYQFVSIQNEHGIVNFPAGCKNSPFKFSMTFPYQPVKIKWLFNGIFKDTAINSPVFDSSWVINGRTLYRYKLNRLYIIDKSATYPITIVADNPTLDGCSGEQEIEYDLQIFERPAAAFNLTQTGCLNDPVTLFDSSNSNGRPVVKWSWNFGDGVLSDLKNPTHTYAKPGNYTITFSSVTDVGCLSDTSKKTVRLTEQPVAGFTIDAPVCENRPVKFLDKSLPAAQGLAKWSWNFNDGSTSTQQNPSHTFRSVGSYNVSLNIETITGCKSAFLMPVKVNYLPIPGFSLPEICLIDPFAEFFDSSKIADNSVNQFTYLWNFGDSHANGANPNSSSMKNPQHKYSAVGKYDVSLQVISREGCSADTIKKITVNGSIPKADFEVNTAAQLCSNEVIALTDRSTVDFGNITKIEIYWDYNNNPLLKTLDDEPVFGKLYKHKYTDFGSPLTKNFQVLYVAYSGINCTQQASKTIVVHASPQVKFEPITPVCEEISAFQLATPNEIFGLSGTGIFLGPGVSSTGIFSPKAASPGIHTVGYKFITLNGCSAFREQTIRVNPSPIADAGPDRTVLEKEYITIAAKVSANGSYLWTPEVAIEDNKILTPKVSPLEDITYQLKVTSFEGCAGLDEISVRVLKEVKVPNAFSPNGDGINDNWQIANLKSYQAANVQVYNRYGQLVFHSTGYDKAWDGTFKGNRLPVGSYYWIIDPKNGRAKMNGSVTIIR